MDTAEQSFRRELGPELGAELRRSRLACGLGLRQAARCLGIDHGYLRLLERGIRAPRGEVAEALIELLRLEGPAAAALRAIGAAVDTGRAERRAARA